MQRLVRTDGSLLNQRLQRFFATHPWIFCRSHGIWGHPSQHPAKFRPRQPKMVLLDPKTKRYVRVDISLLLWLVCSIHAHVRAYCNVGCAVSDIIPAWVYPCLGSGGTFYCCRNWWARVKYVGICIHRRFMVRSKVSAHPCNTSIYFAVGRTRDGVIPVSTQPSSGSGYPRWLY